MVIEVFIDGLAGPGNPGVGAYGFVIYQDKNKLCEGYECLGEYGSNNFAEYCGLVAALHWILDKGLQDEEIVIKSDSMLLVNQMIGSWRVRGGFYVKKYMEARELVNHLPQIRFVWISREKNTEADALSKKAFGEWCKTGKRN